MTNEGRVVVGCEQGCCPGCQFCYGYAIGCHRKKYRCGNIDQCVECNMTVEDGHREGCSFDDE